MVLNDTTRRGWSEKTACNLQSKTCYLLVKMINHSDEIVGYIARNSLYLDFNKTGIPRTEGENNFLGYAINENGLLDIIHTSKGALVYSRTGNNSSL